LKFWRFQQTALSERYIKSIKGGSLWFMFRVGGIQGATQGKIALGAAAISRTLSRLQYPWNRRKKHSNAPQKFTGELFFWPLLLVFSS
jgi:hypothetical protein